MDKNYWIKRAEQTLLDNEKSVLEYEKQLKKAYDSAARSVKLEIQAFYQKYATHNQIDLATARQRLNSSQLKDFHMQLQLYLEEVDRLGLDPKYKKYLQSLSEKAYITKLQEIQTNIRHHIEALAAIQQQRLAEELKKDYQHSFYSTLYILQYGLGFGVSFTHINQKAVEKAINTKWSAEHFSDRVWNNKDALITHLNTTMPVQFVRGRTASQVSRDLAHSLNVDYNSARRLVRTEMNHISNQATVDSYKASEVVDQYEYLSTLDNRTSDICRELDGRVFELKQAQSGVNLPPMHPNCRSTTIPYFGEDTPDSLRTARDAKGDIYYVPSTMNYKEWSKKYGQDSKRN